MKLSRLIMTALCLLLVAGWLAACSDDDSPTKPKEKDTTPPQVIYNDPADGRGGVPVDEDIYVVFNEGMDEDSAAGNLTLAGGTITGTTWEDGRLLIVHHDDFAEGTVVSLTVGTGFADAAGNNLAAAHSFSFTTVSSDLLLMETVPAPDATGVPTNAGIVLQFSESVNTTEIENRVLLTDVLIIKGGNPDKVNFDFDAESLGNNSYLLTPVDDLPASTTIYVWIPTSLTAYNGKTLAESVLFDFTTGTGADTTPPTIVSAEPANGSTNVSPDQGFIRFTFSEPINEDSFDFERYNLGFMILMEFSEVGFWEWTENFTVLTMGLPSGLAAGLPLEFTLSSFADQNGVESAGPYTYEVKVAGNPDYLPFADGNRHYESTDFEEGEIGNPVPQFGDYYNRGVEIDFQGDGSFRELEYNREFTFASGAWEAYKESSTKLEWLGWEEEMGPPMKSNDLVPPLTVVPLPFAAGTWTDTGTVEVEGEGTFLGTIEGTVLSRRDYTIPESGGEAFIKDAWIVVYDLEAELGGMPAVAMHDTVIYAPTWGPLKMSSYEENYGENEWRLENTWRWPWHEYMAGPRKDAGFPRLRSGD